MDNIPNLWPGLEFALSIKSILNIKDCTLPFAGILLGPASSLKTLIIECFRGYKHTFYTDNFSAKAFVSHITGKTEEQLKKDDLLPKLKNKMFMTPELAPTFSSRDEDLLQLLGIITRIVDGQGYESDTGACGHRGYDEDIMFAWLGAAVEISYKVHRLLGTLGPKLYFHRLARIEETEDDYYKTRDQSFTKKKEAIRTALLEYLTYSDMNPDAEINIQKEKPKDSLLKIIMEPEKDEELAHRGIIRVAKLLARLRALVPVWDTRGTQGAEYGFGLAMIEDPSRAITQLRNLARGHALSQGRRYVTVDDLPIIIQTALSTASIERVRIFEILIENKGSLTTNQVCEFLNTSPPTARRTMTELKAIGLVYMETGEGQTPSEITLKAEFDWFLSPQFEELKLLKEKCSSQKGEESIAAATVVAGRPLPIDMYESTMIRKVKEAPSCGGQNSFYKNEDICRKKNTPHKEALIPIQPFRPLKEWIYDDFRMQGCIYCMNNGRYHGPKPLSTYDYESHIVTKHPGRPAYPGPADIEKYHLKLPGIEKGGG